MVVSADSLRQACAPTLVNARRVVIKAGTAVVSTPEGYPSLVRLASIVEQVKQKSLRKHYGVLVHGIP